MGIKESDTGLSHISQWDLVHDKKMMQEEPPLQVAICSKIFTTEDMEALNNSGLPSSSTSSSSSASAVPNPNQKNYYMVKIRQFINYISGLGDKVSPTDIDEGMRVGVDHMRYMIQLPLPPAINPLVSMMEVEEKPDVTYEEVGGNKASLEQLREVVEIPLLHPERFVTLGIDPPKGILLYGPPGTGKTLSARAVANTCKATFIRVIGNELVQKYIGEGAKMVSQFYQLMKLLTKFNFFFFSYRFVSSSLLLVVSHHVSSSLMKLMLSVVLEVAPTRAIMMLKFKELCFRLSQSLMVSMLVVILKFSWLPIVLIH